MHVIVSSLGCRCVLSFFVSLSPELNFHVLLCLTINKTIIYHPNLFIAFELIKLLVDSWM